MFFCGLNQSRGCTRYISKRTAGEGVKVSLRPVFTENSNLSAAWGEAGKKLFRNIWPLVCSSLADFPPKQGNPVLPHHRLAELESFGHYHRRP